MRLPAETLSEFSSDEKIEGSKLLLFSKLDMVIKPENRGLSEFYYDYTDEEFAKKRLQCLAVTKDDIVEVTRKYLDEPLKEGKYSQVIFGNQKSELIKEMTEKGWKIESFIAENVGSEAEAGEQEEH